MIREIIKHNADILKEECKSVPFEQSKRVAQDLIDTLESTSNGVGMAAPQINANARVVVFRESLKDPIKVMIDPKIFSWKGRQTYNEGCLSYPGVFVPVRRHKFVKVTFIDLNNERKQSKFRGFEAVVVQHELDHLEGKCLVGDEWRRRVENLSS